MNIFEKFFREMKEDKPGVVKVEENIAPPVKNYTEVPNEVVENAEKLIEKKETTDPNEQNPNLN